MALSLQASEPSVWVLAGTSPSSPLPQAVPCTETQEPGLTNGDSGLGGCRTSPGDPNPSRRQWQPPDNCSRQPSLISREISGVPAQRDAAARGSRPAEAEHNAAVLAGQPLPGGCQGHPGPSSPLLSPVLHLPCSPPILRATEALSPLCPPGSGGLRGGALGAVERVQLPVRGGQQGPQPPGHRPAAARRGALSRPQAAPRLPGGAPDLWDGQR